MVFILQIVILKEINNEAIQYGHGETVIDYAMGNGMAWHEIEKFKIKEVIGTDYSPRAIQWGKR